MKKEELFNIIGEVDEQKVVAAGMAMNTKKKSRPVWVKWGAMAACLCLVVVGVLYGEYGQAPQQSDNSPGTSVIHPETEKANLIVINEVENVMAADMDVQFSHYDSLSETEREIMLKEFKTVTGFDYNDFLEKISDAYVYQSFYSVNVPADDTEYIPHDYVLEYQTEKSGEVRIAICPDEKPLRDCFIVCNDPKQSEINGISAVIYGYQGTFIAEFSYENVNYEIETENIILDELEDLLVDIMK